jgi:hypothetical protein
VAINDWRWCCYFFDLLLVLLLLLLCLLFVASSCPLSLRIQGLLLRCNLFLSCRLYACMAVNRRWCCYFFDLLLVLLLLLLCLLFVASSCPLSLRVQSLLLRRNLSFSCRLYTCMAVMTYNSFALPRPRTQVVLLVRVLVVLLVLCPRLPFLRQLHGRLTRALAASIASRTHISASGTHISTTTGTEITYAVLATVTANITGAPITHPLLPAALWPLSAALPLCPTS